MSYVKTLINDAICDLGNTTKQRTMIPGEKEWRQRGGYAMLDASNKTSYDNEENKEVKHYGGE